MFIHLTKVAHLGDYRLRVEFNTGSVREVDLFGELHGEIFEPMRDPEFFQRVFVNQEAGTVEWPNGADFAPEFLHENGREIERVA